MVEKGVMNIRDISVIIPAYNEEQRIKDTIIQIIYYLNKNKYNYEIVVIDDGSTDHTIQAVKSIQDGNIVILRNKINRGKGYSVKKGFLIARYSLILFTDSDLATPIEFVETFINYITEGYDIVIASRNLKDSKIPVKQPIFRQIMGKIFCILVNLIVLRGFKDTQCGFKLFKKDTARRIAQFQTLDRFAFDVEILFLAKKLGYKIKEAPVVWTDKKGGSVRAIKDSINMLIDLFNIIYNNLAGKYKER